MFDSARQAGLLRYSYSEDRDLYVAGDLYENDVVTPAMIVVPRTRLLFYSKTKVFRHCGLQKRGALCFFSSCLLPTCIL
ncbi:hypothetical protein JRO89_XS13G0265300 [Xanthoceras sorbifolium]|uniref:Uncharacterized protein n=1 Tax=Xanthoceras sorbifolium TaxID=99658 RepID=A0ABQ8HA20_9ROSI|nr:hypothetical protein JRO89_XS13G0265300 [Xanthoceras sorbifolium]